MFRCPELCQVTLAMLCGAENKPGKAERRRKQTGMGFCPQTAANIARQGTRVDLVLAESSAGVGLAATIAPHDLGLDCIHNLMDPLAALRQVPLVLLQ